MPAVKHVIVTGETQSGKSVYGNQLHQRWGRKSLFFNTNELGGVWGLRHRGPVDRIGFSLAQADKVVFTPSPRPEVAVEELQELVRRFFDWSKRAGWREGSVPWAQLVVDEVHMVNRPAENGENPVLTLTSRGLGSYGVRCVGITQHPGTLDTNVRTNFAARVVFRPGIEGSRFLENYRYPAEVLGWVEHRFHYASYHPELGWRRHHRLPLGPRAGPCPCSAARAYASQA